MKKIIFYTDTPIYGGAERHMLLLADKLDKQAYSVHLVCANQKTLDNWVKEWLEHGHSVTRMKVAHKHDPRNLFQLKQIIKKEKPNLLHIHLWNPASCRYAFSAAGKSVPIVVTEHDPFPLSGIKNSLKKRYLNKTTHVIMVSDANKNLWLQLYPFLKEKISTVHNGIDLELFNSKIIHFSSQERLKIRKELFSAKSDDFVILSVAALHKRKGIDVLINAFAKLFSERENVKLVIAGEGPEQKHLEKLISSLKIFNKIVLLGYQENIPALMKAADLFVLPSRKEAFGLVLTEAMAAQLPIIASCTGGIPEIIHNNKNGILVEPENPDKLAESIMFMIKNKAARDKLTYVAHHDVKTFDAEIMAQKTARIYSKALKKYEA